MDSKLFQNKIQQMQSMIENTIGIINDKSIIIACSDLSKIGEFLPDVDFKNDKTLTYKVQGDYTYHLCKATNNSEYVVFIEGTSTVELDKCKILSVYLSDAVDIYQEKYDKNNFVKNIVLDNILPGDIHTKAREIQLVSDARRAVLLIRNMNQSENYGVEGIKTLFPDTKKDFVFTINETDTVIVKEIKDDTTSKDIENLARSIIDTLSGEFHSKVLVGIGNNVTGLKEIGKSFKEAQVALEVGKVFDTEKDILRYDKLGIGRLIYQLPTTLCEMFLKEVFQKGSIESLDQETLFTIQRFFENNLNVSETSRGLFVHRNTLVYRLEKIKKTTGLDLREFDNAIIFKVALMVKKYLSSNPTKF